MRQLRYCVAASLDGYIAGPKGEYDWIVADSGIDFKAMWARFDILLMGRKTYEVARNLEHMARAGPRWIVVSRTLKPEDHPNVTILSEDVAQALQALKAEEGKDIWLMGGGVLFRSLLDAGLVDGVEVSVMPVLLAGGVPLLPDGRRCPLRWEESETLASGILMLKYGVSPTSREQIG